MKNHTFLQFLSTLFLFAVIFTEGCTLDNVSGSSGDIVTKEDLQAASQILGESLSNDNSGVSLSLNDALTLISKDGFIQKTAAKTTLADRSGRGNEENYVYQYDPETGIHTVSFKRQVDQAVFSKSVTDTLHYIFRDVDGTFIEFPGNEIDRIESINFNGRREGEVSTIRKQSFFVRKDTFVIDGVSNASSILTIDGTHTGVGSIEIDQSQEDILQRFYELEINFLNIEIDKATVQTNGNLQQGVTGTLSWEMLIEKNINNKSQKRTLRGTIEMNGDGTALIRFKDYIKLFQINLDDGDVKDQDDEFEGSVQSVNTGDNSLTLVNGRTVYVNSNTEFDEDYPSLVSVQESLKSNISIWAEGKGAVNNGQFIASEIEFENKDNEDEEDTNGDQIEFEEMVTSADMDANTFTLGDKVVVQVNDQTIIEDNGDYLSLRSVSEALNEGFEVSADGIAIWSSDSESDITAIQVEFESEEDDNEED